MKKNKSLREKNDNLRAIITDNLIYLRKQKKLSGHNLADVLGLFK